MLIPLKNGRIMASVDQNPPKNEWLWQENQDGQGENTILIYRNAGFFQGFCRDEDGMRMV